jgi:hypothetical protein
MFKKQKKKNALEIFASPMYVCLCKHMYTCKYVHTAYLYIYVCNVRVRCLNIETNWSNMYIHECTCSPTPLRCSRRPSSRGEDTCMYVYVCIYALYMYVCMYICMCVAISYTFLTRKKILNICVCVCIYNIFSMLL